VQPQSGNRPCPFTQSPADKKIDFPIPQRDWQCGIAMAASEDSLRASCCVRATSPNHSSGLPRM